MKELRKIYPLDAVVIGKRTQLERQLALLAWVHNRWPHDGYSEPSKPDALTILKEAKAGKHFRCVEYAIVLAQVLQSMGYPARVIGLSRDGMSWGMGKGHVVTEAWNDELRKWFVLDGQNNAIWEEHGVPRDAAEIRDLIQRGKAGELRFVHRGSTWIKDWKSEEQRNTWIKYFHHLKYKYDNRVFDAIGTISPTYLIRTGIPPELLFQGFPISGLQTQNVIMIYPLLNVTHVDVGTGGKDGAISSTLDLTISHGMPWFDHFRIKDNGKIVKHKSEKFRWKLKNGRNRLLVQAVNRAGIAGLPTEIEIDYYPSR